MDFNENVKSFASSLQEDETREMRPQIQARKDEGRVILEQKAAPVMETAAKITPQAKQMDEDIFATITEKLKMAEAEPNPIAAFQHVSDINAAIAKAKTDFTREAQAQALAEYQIPQLEDALKFAEQKDRSHPLWEQYQRDTPETAKVRQQLMTAKSAAFATVDEKLSQNPVYASLVTKAGSLAKAGESILMKKLSKEQQQELHRDAEIRNFTEAVGPEGMKIASTLFPDQAAAGEGNVVAAVMLSPKKKEILELTQTKKEFIPTLGFRGNMSALNYTEMHEKRAGLDENAAFISEGYRITQDVTKAAEALTYLASKGIFAGKQGKELKAQYERALNPVLQTNAEARQESKKLVANIAERYVRIKVANSFNENIMGRGTEPAWLREAVKSPQVSATGQISIDQALGLATRSGTKEEQAAKLKELTAYYEQAVAEHNGKGSLFPLDPFEVNKLKAKATVQYTGFGAGLFGWN